MWSIDKVKANIFAMCAAHSATICRLYILHSQRVALCASLQEQKLINPCNRYLPWSDIQINDTSRYCNRWRQPKGLPLHQLRPLISRLNVLFRSFVKDIMPLNKALSLIVELTKSISNRSNFRPIRRKPCIFTRAQVLTSVRSFSSRERMKKPDVAWWMETMYGTRDLNRLKGMFDPHFLPLSQCVYVIDGRRDRFDLRECTCIRYRDTGTICIREVWDAGAAAARYWIVTHATWLCSLVLWIFYSKWFMILDVEVFIIERWWSLKYMSTGCTWFYTKVAQTIRPPGNMQFLQSLFSTPLNRKL